MGERKPNLYSSNSQSVSSHVAKAARRAQRDANRSLYGKTKDQYNDVVESLVQLSEALSKILNKKVTVLVEDVPVDQQLAFHLPTVYQQVESVEGVKELKHKVAKLSKRVDKVNAKVDKISDAVCALADNNKLLGDNVLALSQVVLGEKPSASTAKVEPVSTNSDSSAGLSDTVSSSSICNKPVKSHKEDEVAARSFKQSKRGGSDKKDVFENSRIKKTYHAYGDDQATDFFETYYDLMEFEGSSQTTCNMVSSSAKWLHSRLCGDNGLECTPANKRTYHLYQIPRVLAYYAGACAKIADEHGDVYGYDDFGELFDEFNQQVQDNPTLPYIAPTYLCANSGNRVELNDYQVVVGYGYWLKLVDDFNKLSTQRRTGLSLENSFYTSKMWALGFGSEDLLYTLQGETVDTFDFEHPEKYLTEVQ